MPAVTDYPVNNGIGRRVSIRRDDDDFVVAFQPEDYVISEAGTQMNLGKSVVSSSGRS
jgi:hypothetical protein